MPAGLLLPPACPLVETLEPLLRFACVVSKDGEPMDECQDAVAASPERGQFAIADGATTSFLAGLWARRLVAQFRDADLDTVRALLADGTRWAQWLKPAIAGWRMDVEELLEDVGGQRKTLLLSRLRDQDPAASTFVGLSIEPPFTSWRAVAVGDSCLFHVRNGRLLKSFPLEASTEFDSSTECLATSGSNDLPARSFATGSAQAGDLFLLATDATAKWLLRQKEQGEAAWAATLRKLLAVDAPSEFHALVQRTRRDGISLDDDVGLLVVSLELARAIPRRHGPGSGPDLVPDHSYGFPALPQGSGTTLHRSTDAGDDDPRPRNEWESPDREPRLSRWMIVSLAGTLLTLLVSLATLDRSFRTRAEVKQLVTRVDSLRREVERTKDGTSARPLSTDQGQSRTIVLDSGSVVRSEPRDGAKGVFTLRRVLSVTGTPAAEGWDSVDLSFWIAERSGETILASVQGDSVVTTQEVNARVDDANGDLTIIIGTLATGRFARVPKSEGGEPGSSPTYWERPDPTVGRRLQVRAHGFARSTQ